MNLIEYLRGLEAKAAPGPWHSTDDAEVCNEGGVIVWCDSLLVPDQASCDLIAASRNALPALLRRLGADEAAVLTLEAFTRDYADSSRTPRCVNCGARSASRGAVGCGRCEVLRDWRAAAAESERLVPPEAR